MEPIEPALFATVANRALGPQSKLSCWERRLDGEVFFPGAVHLELHPLYRLMGFLAASAGQPWLPQGTATTCHPGRKPPSRSTTDGDSSESARRWFWVCGLLEAGWNGGVIYRNLVEKAHPRRRNDAERYARRTIATAIRRAREPRIARRR